jgi:glycosyltransferase involved in cell wall biosynthesis
MSAPGTRSRVLLMTETYWPEIGGGERQARLLAQGLAARGHEVTIVARRSRAGTRRRDLDGQVQVLRLPPTGRGRWRKWLLVLPAFGALLWRRRRYDIVLVAGFRWLGIAAMLARLLTGKPTVLKADSSGELSGEYFRAGLAQSGIALESWPARSLLGLRNALLRRADAFVSLSDTMTRELQAHGVPAERIRQIGNGVDTAIFHPATPEERAALRARLGLPAGDVAIYTGRLVSYKGLALLVRVWRDIAHATLVLVGEGGNDIHACEAELQDFVAANGLSERVRFTGPVDNVHDWLRAADIFVFPTENEAFGLSLVEAMACGLASVTTTVGGLRDFVVDGANALAVPVADAGALTGGIRALLADPELRSGIGRSARRTAEERFGAATIAKDYAALFERLRTLPHAGTA